MGAKTNMKLERHPALGLEVSAELRHEGAFTPASPVDEAQPATSTSIEARSAALEPDASESAMQPMPKLVMLNTEDAVGVCDINGECS